MRNYYAVLLILLVFLSPQLFSQYSYNVKTENFRQVDETTIKWDVYLQKASGSADFYLWKMTMRWDYDKNAIVNGGAFENFYFTVVAGADATSHDGFYDDDDCTVFETVGPQFQWGVTNPPSANPNGIMTLLTDDWKHIATLTAQLRKGGAPHNFASAVMNFAHQSTGQQIQVEAPTVQTSPYDGSDILLVPRNNAIPALGAKIESRQLAGYWFSGEGNWAEAASWNNVTTVNKNTLPGANSNAIINGNCTIPTGNSYSLLPASGNGGELTVLTGLATTYSLTVIPHGTNINVSIYGAASAGYPVLSNPVDLLAGDEVNLSTSGGFGSGSFLNWTDQYNNVLSTNTNFGPYYMPSSDMTITANWTIGSKNAQFQGKESKVDLYASLTIAPGGELTVDKLFNDNENGAPAVLIQSNETGTGSLIHNFDNVPATIQRYIPANNGNSVYHLVSVPLTQASNPLSGLFKWSYLFEFTATAQTWTPLGTPTNTPLFVNQGYMIYKYPGPEKWQNDTTYSFAGPINNGDFTCNVTYPDLLDNHNLVPNPYPSAIDWDAGSGWTKTNIYDAIWIWNPTAKNYAAYGSNAGTNGATKYIPVGQSFFVSASAAAPALMMNNDVRVHDNQAFLKNENEIVELLRIHSSANSFSDEAIIRFSDGATAAFDGQFDVTKFYGNADAPQLFSMSSDSKELSINSLEVGAGKRFVDLGFKLEATGMCTFIFSGIESFNPDMQIHLTDRVTGQTIDLRANPEYTFAHSPENDPMRFELTFNGVTSIDEVKAVNQDFFYVDGRLYLNFPQESRGPFNVTVYNINGQIEFMGVAHEAGAVVDLTSLTSGFHIVRVVTSDYSGEKKIVVK